SHPRVTRKQGKAYLAGATATHAADADAGLAHTYQSSQQAGPPFSRRRSPNRPKLPSMSASECRRSHHRFREWNKTQEWPWRCVNIVGLDRAIQYAVAAVVCSNWQHGVLDAPLEAGHDSCGLGYRVTC